MSGHGNYGRPIDDDGKVFVRQLQMREKARYEELEHMTKAVAVMPMRRRQPSESDAVARRNSFVLIQGGRARRP
jgi:hypothetical protein